MRLDQEFTSFEKSMKEYEERFVEDDRPTKTVNR